MVDKNLIDRLPSQIRPDKSELQAIYQSKDKPRAQERFTEAEMEDMRRGYAQRLQQVFRGLNPTEIARLLKTTDATVRPYLEGKRFPIHEIEIRIQNVTGVSLDWLKTGKGRMFLIAEDDFTAEESAQIQEMAKRRGYTFQEQVRNLAVAGLEFLRRLK